MEKCWQMSRNRHVMEGWKKSCKGNICSKGKCTWAEILWLQLETAPRRQVSRLASKASSWPCGWQEGRGVTVAFTEGWAVLWHRSWILRWLDHWLVRWRRGIPLLKIDWLQLLRCLFGKLILLRSLYSPSPPHHHPKLSKSICKLLGVSFIFLWPQVSWSTKKPNVIFEYLKHLCLDKIIF